MVEIDVITVVAYKCVHCEGLFLELDLALSHVDKCPSAHAAYYKKTGVYLETDFGNMILKEGAA